MSTLTFPSQAITLADAAPDPEQSGDWWHLAEMTADPHEDYTPTDGLPRLLALYCAAGTPFCVRRLPGATEEMLIEAAQDQQVDTLRWHPSLSAATRNA